jgi:hypothetical protein
MTAGENQPQPVVLDILAVLLHGSTRLAGESPGRSSSEHQPGATAQAVDRLE